MHEKAVQAKEKVRTDARRISVSVAVMKNIVMFVFISIDCLDCFVDFCSLDRILALPSDTKQH